MRAWWAHLGSEGLARRGEPLSPGRLVKCTASTSGSEAPADARILYGMAVACVCVDLADILHTCTRRHYEARVLGDVVQQLQVLAVVRLRDAETGARTPVHIL